MFVAEDALAVRASMTRAQLDAALIAEESDDPSMHLLTSWKKLMGVFSITPPNACGDFVSVIE